MVAQNPALFLSTGAHSAESFRRLTQAAAFDGEGVVGVDDLQVVQHASGANLTVDVASGSAYIKGTEAPSTQGTYFVDNQGTVVLTVPTPDARLDRIDLVAARVRDGSYSGNVHRWDIHYQTGVAAATPTVPEADFNTLVLAEIRVTAGLATVTNAHITDRRTRAFTGFIEPFMVGSIDGADVTGNVTSATTALTANVATTATTATRLGTQRTIALTGDAVGSATFDGSSNIAIEVQSSLTADDIPDLAASKVTSGVFDPARLPAVTLATGPVDATTIDASGDLNIADKVLFVDASAGYVGINHENPGVALDVTGDSWVSGLATFRGGIDAEGNASFDTDTLFIDAANDRVGIGTNVPASTLGIDGILTVAGDTNVTGSLTVAGTSGLAATTVSGGLNVGSGHLRVRTGGNISMSEDVTVDGTVTAATAAITGGLTVGGSELVVDTTAGRVGVGRSPDHDLDVAGTMRVSGDVVLSADLDVTGSITGSIAAGNVTTGMFGQSRIPNLPAGQITSGVFTQGRIPNLDASKITSGVLDAARLPPVSGTIGTATNLAGGTVDATTIEGSGDLNIDDGVLFVDVSSNRVGIGTETPASTLDVVGSAVVSGTLNTDVLEVTDRAQITDLVLSGTFIGSIGADQITFGVINQARIPNTDAAKITSGTVAPARIPDLDASKITTGVIDQLRLPPLSGNWDRARTLTVTGDSSGTVSFDGSRDIDLVLDAAQLVAADIPTLNASKITSGTFTAARIPALNASKTTAGVFTANRIPGLDASKITSGTFAAGRIPDIDASKLTSGTIDAARLPPVSGTIGTATNLAGGTVEATTITGSGDMNIDNGLLFVDVSANTVNVGTTITGAFIEVVGGIRAQAFHTIDIFASGVVETTNLNVSGTFTGSIGAGQITTGTLATARVPNLPASKITSGTFGQARLPNFNANKITNGTFTANRIPGLDASKITTGVFDPARIPNLPASKITGVFAVERIPGLDASKLTSGIIDAARLPASSGGFAGGALTATTITGTDDMDIGAKTFFVDVSSNNVGINHTSPNVALDIVGDTWTSGMATVRADLNAGVDVLFVDASTDRVGINTTTPTKALDVVGDVDASGALAVGGNTTMAGRLSVTQTAILNDVTATTLTVDNTTLVVDSVNNRVGVGTSTPNTTLGVAGTLGVTSNANIVGNLTAGTGALTVTGANNRVGINQAAPEHSLDVNGTGRFTGTLRTQNISSFGNLTVSGSTITTSTAAFGGDTTVTGDLAVSGNATFGGLDAGQITSGTISADRLPATTSARHDGTDLVATTITGSGDLNIDSGVLFADTSLNRVGINDTTPEHSLDVNGTMAVRGASFFSGAAGFGVINASGNLTVDTTTLHVDAENNSVGIGTVTPARTLDVVGTLGVTGQTTLTQGITVGRTDLVVNTATNRVGIGTATPTVALDVLGDINTSTNIVADGDVTVGGDLTVDGSARYNNVATFTGTATTFAGLDTAFTSPRTEFSGDEVVFSGTSTILRKRYQIAPGDFGNESVRIPKIWVQTDTPPSGSEEVGDLWVTV